MDLTKITVMKRRKYKDRQYNGRKKRRTCTSKQWSTDP